MTVWFDASCRTFQSYKRFHESGVRSDSVARPKRKDKFMIQVQFVLHGELYLDLES